MENNEEKKIKKIEEEGHDATADELEPLEPATPAGEGATETTIPEETDGVAEENTFPSEPAHSDND
jgi:hypothetical protein